MAQSSFQQIEATDDIMIIEALSSPALSASDASGRLSSPGPSIRALVSPTPSTSISLSSVLPTQMRIQQYRDISEQHRPQPAERYKIEGAIQALPPNHTLIGALFLSPRRNEYSAWSPSRFISQSITLQFQPILYWFRIKRQTKLRKLM